MSYPANIRWRSAAKSDSKEKVLFVKGLLFGSARSKSLASAKPAPRLCLHPNVDCHESRLTATSIPPAKEMLASLITFCLTRV